MAAPTDNDIMAFRTYSSEQKAEALFYYLYDTRYSRMEDVAQDVFGDRAYSQQVSCIMRCYGFDDRNANYFSKKKKYNLTPDDFMNFVKKYPNALRSDHPYHHTIDEFMKKAHERNSNPQEEEEEVTQRTDSKSSSYYPETGSSGSGAGILIGGIILVIIVLFVVFKLITGFVFRNFEYHLENFSYNGENFAGNKSFGKPKGYCMKIKNISGDYFVIGDMKGSKISGEGAIANEDTLLFGELKNGKPKGWCMEQNRDTSHSHLAQFKSGKKSGYGICVNNGKTNIVKFKGDEETVVASYTGSSWINEKGKEVKVKDSYKHITITDAEHYTVDGKEIRFAPNFIEYKNDMCMITSDQDAFYFENNINDDNMMFCVQFFYGKSLEIDMVDIKTMTLCEQLIANP